MQIETIDMLLFEYNLSDCLLALREIMLTSQDIHQDSVISCLNYLVIHMVGIKISNASLNQPDSFKILIAFIEQKCIHILLRESHFIHIKLLIAGR